MKKELFRLDGIDCIHCARELEEEVAKIEGVKDVHLEFGMPSLLRYACEEQDAERIEKRMREIMAEDEDHPEVTRIQEEVKEFKVEGLDCVNCAREIEEKVAEIEGIHDVVLQFGMPSLLSYQCAKEDSARIEQEMKKIMAEDEDHPTVTPVSKTVLRTYQYRFAGIDCANCFNQLAEQIHDLAGVKAVDTDFMSETLSLTCSAKERSRIEAEMIELVKKAEPDVEVKRKEETEKKTAREEETGEEKKMLVRLVLGAVLFVLAMVLDGTASLVLSLLAYLVLGYDVLLKALRGIGRGQLFDENFLMAVATLAALWLKDYKEAAGVMLFYQIGEFFQDMAVEKSRRSIADLMDIRPDRCEVQRNGEWLSVDPEEVEPGEVVRVKPGEKVPLDGVVLSGVSSLNTASLTGESRPRDVEAGDEVISGSVNMSGVLIVTVLKEYGESTVAKILDLVENQTTHKAQQEKFITKFSRVYTPLVVFAAILTAIVVSIGTGDINEGLYRACTFLVISCPCALVISIPLSFFGGIGGLSSRGVLVKGADLIAPLAHVKQLVMDKTGTLTTGTFAVSVLKGEDCILEDAAACEQYSSHPIAAGIRKAYGKEIEEARLCDAKELAGRGQSVVFDGHVILAGNEKLMKENGIEVPVYEEVGTRVYVAKDGVYEGCIILMDEPKAGAREAVEQLNKNGCAVAMVSGDHEDLVQATAKKLGIQDAHGQCLPQDKVALVEGFKKKGLTGFVGDGVNDAPVLAVSDISFAMGGLGSQAAIEAADVVIMDDQMDKIPLAIQQAKRILLVANENIYGAIAVKILILILGAFGKANLWMAIFADTGVAMLCVLNSLRLLRIRRK